MTSLDQATSRPVLASTPLPRSPRQMLDGWRTRSRASHKLAVIGTVLMGLAAAALIMMVWQLRRDALAETRQNLSAMSIAIAEQASRSVQAADLVLQDLRRQIETKKVRSVEEFKAAVADEELFRFLKDRADILPQVDALTIIAADGKLANFSRQWPTPAVDLSDRDYVHYMQEHRERDAFISAPVNNRGNGSWTSYLVRRIDTPEGKFVGLVLAAVDLEYFRDFFKTVSGKDGASVSLIRRDGQVLTSYPTEAKPGESVSHASAWYDVVSTGPGALDDEGLVMRSPSIIAVRPLKDYPLVVNVSQTREVALADWTRTSMIIGLASMFAITCFTMLIGRQIAQFRRLEQSETMLADRNAALQSNEAILRRQADELSAGRAVMAEQSATLEAALRHMNQGIIMVNASDRVVVCNDRAAEMLDLPRSLMDTEPSFEELMAYQDSIGEFADPASRQFILNMQEAMAGPQRYERARPNGTILEIQTVPMQGGGLVRTYTDITERRRTEQQVSFLARHDPVTGLYNRIAFNERFQALLTEAKATRQQLGVFYLDLDGFKQVNDTHGHAVGDKLLIGAAQRLRAAIRDTDVVARMGGDEFAVVQPFSGAGGNVADLARRMLASVSEPYWIGHARCVVSLSIGVALFPEHGEDPAELLQGADLALYRAKAEGKATFRLFEPESDHAEKMERPIENDLAQAVANDELYLEYQPIVDTLTLSVIRYEALLRWVHPVRGRVMPSDFVPVAERSGLIVPIGLWALETACVAAMGWPEGVGISVNLSPRQFGSEELAYDIERILQRTGLDPQRLNLEITEGVLLENTALVVATMKRLRELGIRFSLDDFGTAYAGLTYLRSFSFDVLKIDKSFVQDAVKNPEARELLAAIHAIGAACHLQVVAEGVETEEELAVIRELHCDQAQGYLLGRPRPLPALQGPTAMP